MAISDKLTYLNTTKGKIKDSINNLGGSIDSNTTFRDYATQLDSIYARLPKVTGTGSNITLTPTLKGRLGSVINGDTKQSILPSEYTQVDYIESSGTQYIDSGYLMNNNSSFEFKFSPQASSGHIFGVSGYARMYLQNTTNRSYEYVRANVYYEYGTYQQDVIHTFKLTPTKYIMDGVKVLDVSRTIDNCPYNMSIFARNNQNAISAYSSIKLYYFKVYEENTLIYNFIPCYRNSDNEVGLYDLVNNVFYTNQGTGSFTYGAVVPSPDSPLEIQSVEGIQNISVYGKNLFDKDTILSGYEISGGTIYANPQWFVSDYIPVKYGETYVKNVNGGNSYILYDENKTQITDISSAFLNNKTTISLANAKYIRINYYLTGVDTYQLEKGSTTTDYQPYQTPQNYEVNLGDIKLYNGDYITGTPDNWSIYRENGEATLTGSESYSTWGLKSTDYFSAYTYKLSSKPAVTNGNIKCDYLPFSNYTVVANATNMGCFTGGTYIGISVPKSILSDTSTQANAISSFKSWITSNNMNFVYELATPTTTPITDTYLISQLNALYNAKSYNGQTNITVSGQLPMILEVSALKGE